MTMRTEITKFKDIDAYTETLWMPLALGVHELALYQPRNYFYPSLVKYMPLEYLEALRELKTNTLNIKIYYCEGAPECVFFDVPMKHYEYNGKPFEIKKLEAEYSSKEKKYFRNLKESIHILQDKGLLENYRRIIHAIPTPFDAKVMENFAAYGYDYYSKITDEWAFFWLPNGDIAIYF